MGAPTETYVDPSIAADSGAGSIGDPYGDLQYALNQVTRDGTNGDRMNIKAGTDEVLAAKLTLATYGTPTNSAPLIFQGYTSTQGDGGQGGIDCNGQSFATASYNALEFKDIHLHNAGSSTLLNGNSYLRVINCELDNTSGHAIVGGNFCSIVGSNIYNVGNRGVFILQGFVGFNYFKNDTNDFSVAIYAAAGGQGQTILRNVFSLDGASIAIQLADSGAAALQNSILSAGGTGTGIYITTGRPSIVLSNAIEGFSGSGGYGIFTDSTDDEFVDYNSAYNCETDFSLSGTIFGTANNETLSASPFAKSGADTFANRYTYFALVDTGNVIGGAYQ